MSEIFFRGTFNPQSHVSEDAGNIQQVKRRQFFQIIGVVGIGLALFPKDLFGQCVESEAGRWLDTNTRFIYTVADRQQARAMTSQLSQASIVHDPTYTNFHDYYASPFIFRGATISPQPVTCGNGYQVNRLPYYDERCPCRSVNDLNDPEMHGITNPEVIARVKCVATPDSYRAPVDMRNSDHSNAYNRAASENGVDPREWHPPIYRRRLKGRNRAHTGYLLIHKKQKASQGHHMPRFIVSSDI